MTVIHILVSLLLLSPLAQASAPAAERNVFIDLGEEHCAEEIAIAAYENTMAGEVATTTSAVYATYSAFTFGSAEQAHAALEDLPRLVAETYVGEDVEIAQGHALDELIAAVPVEDYGDERVAYMMTLPVNDGELDVLLVDMLGIRKGRQLLLILQFNNPESRRSALAFAEVALLPYTDGIDAEWTGDDDLKDAIPEEDEMPPNWAGQGVTVGELPPCGQQ